MHHLKTWGLPVMGILYLISWASGDQPKIVIIGAGASGIAAASKLFENGFQNVTVLEAENRIGGRVNTVRFDESWIDLGGQTVEETTNTVVFDLAGPLRLLDIPQGTDKMNYAVYNSKGDQLPTAISNDLIEFFFTSTIIDDGVNGNNRSIGDYVTRMFNVELKKYPTVNETLARQFMKLFDGITMASNAAENWYELSVRGYQESFSPSEDLKINWKDRGYGTILDVLMKKYPNPEKELPVLNNTFLNTEVTNINYNSTEGKALVTTSDGRRYVADHVIMTPSLGVLKEQYETLFTPQLPEAKVKTIKGLGFGTTAKIYLSFEEPWWSNDFPYFAFIWEDDDRQEYENDPDKKWLLDIVNFDTVAHRPRLLCGHTSGASAKHMETLTDDQVFNQTFALINKFLGKSYNITRPTGFIRSQWHSNKHFRGTYSLRTMESERADVWANDLAAPLLVNDKPILMFAGEATHARRYGTVNAAVEAGFREANRLIAAYPDITK